MWKSIPRNKSSLQEIHFFIAQTVFLLCFCEALILLMISAAELYKSVSEKARPAEWFLEKIQNRDGMAQSITSTENKIRKIKQKMNRFHMFSYWSIRRFVLPPRICRNVLYLSRPARLFSICNRSYSVNCCLSLTASKSAVRAYNKENPYLKNYRTDHIKCIKNMWGHQSSLLHSTSKILTAIKNYLAKTGLPIQLTSKLTV